ncbi:MAG: AAA family ATPase [Candidatus Hydrogenedentes bacterium]|nr:AAA family ATPase [Candidatus Hydrogenedentota bacterium]
MKITRLWIDGYGCISSRALEFLPGFQVILGPNEQGKTTLRGFITDALYGQKRSTTQSRYDEANELRKPWLNADAYGGRLSYRLDGGREFEVRRVFDRRRESVQLYDLTHARDVTGEFPMLRNREPAFADAHLGLSKAVFTHTATISHLTLENLGDEEALSQIREKMLSLADTGEGERSADTALRSLEDRIGEIGRPQARTKPLPVARARLAELDREYQQARGLRQECAEMEVQRRGALEEIEALRSQQTRLAAETQTLEKVERANRLRDVETLVKRVDDVTQHCFALGAARNFPLEQLPNLQRMENEVATARSQIQRTESDRANLQDQLRQELERLGPAATQGFADLPEEFEQRLTEQESQSHVLRHRLEELEAAERDRDTRLSEVQESLRRLPDFSRISGDPLEWLNQVGNSFSQAVRTREDERARLTSVRSQGQQVYAEIAGPAHVFEDVPDFPERARDYEVSCRVADEKDTQAQAELEELHAAEEDFRANRPTYRWMAIFCFAALACLIAAAQYSGNKGTYIAAALTAGAVVWYLANWVYARESLKRVRTKREETDARLTRLRDEHRLRQEAMEQLITAGGCTTIRELEALFEKYRSGCERLNELKAALDQQAAKNHEEDSHVAQLLAWIQEQFRFLGEEITGENDVPSATPRIISRYQEYRDGKRRLTEIRDQLMKLKADAKQAKEELDNLLKLNRDCSLEVRRLLRENGYVEEAKHTSALRALRAYRLRCAQLRHERGRVEVLQEKVAGLERQLEAERRDLEEHEKDLARQLRAVGAESMEASRELGEQARAYREAWNQRSTLNEQLERLLANEDLDSLRARVASEGPLPALPARSAEAVKAEAAAINGALEARVREEHALHVALAERYGRARPIFEIEEERHAAAAQVRELELELEAAAYAAAIIEEVARDKHARIAPRLAALAGRHLAEITDGAYQELLISRNLHITVRSAQTGRLNEDPERLLSKGTVDQVYLSLRLAMVQSLAENNESIPMLLDDPFANYDDARLGRAIALLQRLAESCQILLFTCREDVARVAQSAHVPIIKL